MKGCVAKHDEQKLIDLGGGVTRRILSYDSQLMSVEVGFEQGAEPTPTPNAAMCSPANSSIMWRMKAWS